ncbi:hypothetical protein GCM10010402_47860 [Actinomadura luteofluorescens]
MHESVTARSRRGDVKIDKVAGQAGASDGASGSDRVAMTISGSRPPRPGGRNSRGGRSPYEVSPRIFISLRFVEYGAYWSSPD